MAWDSDAKVKAVLDDVDTAPISAQLRATLKMLGKLTKEHTIGADDMTALLAIGVTQEQIKDALAVCFAFNTIARLADAFEFHVGPHEHFKIGAKALLTRGYR
jgi:alkylhydroperoxidase family enzyme